MLQLSRAFNKKEKGMQTFGEYVKTRSAWREKHERFVWSVERDKDFPQPQSWAALRDYLIAKKASEDVIQSAHFFWQKYIQYSS
ncbi:hypothetical protein ACQKH5_08565 [Hyphomonas sp. NPDC076900]|uniref:hypothetical protein n=2 Tax=unclassified Hyphomonas TaxID=2630699 RepID=UPI003CFF0940